MASVVLDRILDTVQAELRRRRAEMPLRALRSAAEAAPQPPSLRRHLTSPGRPVRIIAEIKRASPSRGWIRKDLDPAMTARMLASAGAAALSVLTEERHFRGSPAMLRAAAAATSIPVLRKDFIVATYQLYEARAWGAGAVLLIAAILDTRALGRLLSKARELGLDVLAEAHDEEELRRLLDAGADIVGINCRDLRTFTLDREKALALLQAIPDGCVRVAESGVRGADDIRALLVNGADALLVGETLMRAPDPGSALRALLEDAGRAGANPSAEEPSCSL